jgi:hypothetical protein
MRDAELEGQKKIIKIQKQLLNTIFTENEKLVTAVLADLKIPVEFLKSGE